jgi:hypothetical protein
MNAKKLVCGPWLNAVLAGWLFLACGDGQEMPVDPADARTDADVGPKVESPDAGLTPTSDAGVMNPRRGCRAAAPPSARTAGMPGGAASALVPLPDGLPLGHPERLAPSELARRLSRAFWGQEPTPAFTDWVTGCAPLNVQILREMVSSLLADPRAAGGLRAFAERWLDLAPAGAVADKADPALTPELQAAMREETLLFVSDVALKPGARLGDLLGQPSSFVTPALAQLYGLSPPPGPGFARVALDPAARAGVLTQGSVLVATSGRDRRLPSLRGRWVQTQLLCRQVPRDPVPDRPGPPPSSTLRPWLTDLTRSQPCNGCHQTIDPYGFALDAFDPIGRFQPAVDGQPVDTKVIVELGPDAVSVDGAPSLAKALGASTEAQQCFARTWLSHATGTPVPATDASPDFVRQVLAHPLGDLRAALAVSAITETFLAP